MKKVSGGIGLLQALFLVFLVLKLCGVINWSWWLVTAPLWVPLLGIMGLLSLVGMFFLLCVAIAVLKEKRKYTIVKLRD